MENLLHFGSTEMKIERNGEKHNEFSIFGKTGKLMANGFLPQQNYAIFLLQMKWNWKMEDFPEHLWISEVCYTSIQWNRLWMQGNPTICIYEIYNIYLIQVYKVNNNKKPH